jgi:hypothetical protein
MASLSKILRVVVTIFLQTVPKSEVILHISVKKVFTKKNFGGVKWKNFVCRETSKSQKTGMILYEVWHAAILHKEKVAIQRDNIVDLTPRKDYELLRKAVSVR